jgi:hypothetical protein
LCILVAIFCAFLFADFCVVVITDYIYAEVDEMKSRSINEEYYNKHIPVINQRILQAGYRLAALLNEISKRGNNKSALIPSSQDHSVF